MSKSPQFFATPSSHSREIIGHHVCEVCGSLAMWGVEVSYLRGHPGRWYCREHLPADAYPARENRPEVTNADHQ